MQLMVFARGMDRCVGVDNWSRLHTKLVALCPDFTKDSEACRKKWSVVYNEYKEDKSMNLRSGSDRSEKCRWYTLVDEFMSDRAHVISHAHASATNPDGPKISSTTEANTTKLTSGESITKSPEPKRREEVFMERCLGEIRESSDRLMDTMKTDNEMKMTLLLGMQGLMQKMIEKM